MSTTAKSAAKTLACHLGTPKRSSKPSPMSTWARPKRSPMKSAGSIRGLRGTIFQPFRTASKGWRSSKLQLLPQKTTRLGRSWTLERFGLFHRLPSDCGLFAILKWSNIHRRNAYSHAGSGFPPSQFLIGDRIFGFVKTARNRSIRLGLKNHSQPLTNEN